jgi:hypothetical protein
MSLVFTAILYSRHKPQNPGQVSPKPRNQNLCAAKCEPTRKLSCIAVAFNHAPSVMVDGEEQWQ